MARADGICVPVIAVPSQSGKTAGPMQSDAHVPLDGLFRQAYPTRGHARVNNPAVSAPFALPGRTAVPVAMGTSSGDDASTIALLAGASAVGGLCGPAWQVPT